MDESFMNDPHVKKLITDLAARHNIPETNIRHPEGVIVPGDEFMTIKLAGDTNYVPYCMKHAECCRVRRTEYGFECPTCKNKMNYDLTHYDGNINVQYSGNRPVISIDQWNHGVEARKLEKTKRKADR